MNKNSKLKLSIAICVGQLLCILLGLSRYVPKNKRRHWMSSFFQEVGDSGGRSITPQPMSAIDIISNNSARNTIFQEKAKTINTGAIQRHYSHHPIDVHLMSKFPQHWSTYFFHLNILIFAMTYVSNNIYTNSQKLWQFRAEIGVPWNTAVRNVLSNIEIPTEEKAETGATTPL